MLAVAAAACGAFLIKLCTQKTKLKTKYIIDDYYSLLRPV